MTTVPLLLALMQIMEGELRVNVADAAGRGVAARVWLRSNNVQAEQQADAAGSAVFQRLPPGIFVLEISHSGFAPTTQRVELRSAVPHDVRITLNVAAVATELTIQDTVPLIDPAQPSPPMHSRGDALASLPGRSMIETVNGMPGWLLEANAVLHPRGSEYDTQYVLDGMPLYDNRSLAFAPAFETDEFESINVMTGGMPARYGRRLGGVIALDTKRIDSQDGRTDLRLQGGTQSTLWSSLSHSRRFEKIGFLLGAHGGHTDRYLDPPSLENYTNKATTAGFNARFDQDVSEGGRLSLYLRSNRTGFLVPNDPEQQRAGQRQDRANAETSGQVHFQQTLSSTTLASVRALFRDLSAELWSNPFSTPVNVQSDRGLRESAINGNISVDLERHSIEFGADFRAARVRERFLIPGIDFAERRTAYDASVFVQDHFRWNRFALNAGVRVDRHRMLIEDTAVSPRVAASYWLDGPKLLLRASYDRVFQPPPLENLLLSSAAAGFNLDDVEGAIPVPASRAHFYEIGLRQSLFDRMRVDVRHYWRRFRNFADDDVFLNTGVGFPISFDSARIRGTEVRVELPNWQRVSSWISYANMKGTATSPVTGGLFIEGGEAEELRDQVETFPISQDQRHTLAAQIRVQPHRLAWLIGGANYGSGLPVELDDDPDLDDVPQEILRKVDLDRERLRSNFSLNLGAGWQVHRAASLQFTMRNATNRLNVINFSGLFSGTALAPRRQAFLQLNVRF